MEVEFQFDFARTLAAITYIASRNIPDLTTYKILKLLFFADKFHLVRYGRTITGDKYAALPDGPVPSRIYDLFKRQVLKKPFTEEGRKIIDYLEVDKSEKYPLLRARRPYDRNELSKSDITALDAAVNEAGKLNYEQLKDATHKLAAFDRAWKSRGFWNNLKNSAPMKFEDFFEDDKNVIEGAKTEMLENDLLRKAFAQRRTV